MDSSYLFLSDLTVKIFLFGLLFDQRPLLNLQFNALSFVHINLKIANISLEDRVLFRISVGPRRAEKFRKGRYGYGLFA